MQPRFPLYVVSKGRSAYMITSKVLTRMGVRHFVVVEPEQAEDYRAAVASLGLLADVIEMDMSLKASYELCDDLGLTKSTGSGPARNFARVHSSGNGARWHWVIDDNILGFYRLNQNLKVPVSDGAIFRAMEDFSDRYENLAMAGPNYFMFASRKTKMPPFLANTRIYSCNLIRNDLPFWWRGRYNEDVIFSLDLLKAGWTTVLFNAFLQEKMVTQALPGGNTDELYHGGASPASGLKYSATGTLDKSQMLARVHPDVATVAMKWGRVHHHVDYRPFKRQKLIRRRDLIIPQVPDNYGMKLITVGSR